MSSRGLWIFLCLISAGVFAEPSTLNSLKPIIVEAVKVSVRNELVKKGVENVQQLAVSVSAINLNNLTQCDFPKKVDARYENNIINRVQGEHTFLLSCDGLALGSAQATVMVERNQRVAARVLVRGETITAQNSRIERVSYTKALGDNELVLGMVAKRRLREGQVIAVSLVDKPSVIERGQKVIIIAGDALVSASIEGEALASGAVGDTIRVRNLQSKKTLEGQVRDANYVLVGRF